MSMAYTHLTYLVVSVLLTAWVGRTLHHRGRIFLVDAFRGEEKLADSINDLLLVGFYLINFGYVCLALRLGTRPTEAAETVEYLSTKLGAVMLILGVMHFFNLWAFARWRNSARRTASRATPFREVYVAEACDPHAASTT